ncbi:MAG: hypothetical protein AB1393_11420 [Candidatus Edwardsbacteria bacterium]
MICALLWAKEALSQESYWDRIRRIKATPDSNKIKAITDTTCISDSNASRQKYYWANLGLWLSTKTLEGIFDVNINYAVKNNIFTGQYEVVTGSTPDILVRYAEESRTYGLLYGRYYSNELMFASLSGGFSLVSVDDGVKKRTHTVGVPIKAQLMIRGKYVGFGISGHVNMNSKMPYQKICLTISLGKLE